MGLSTDENSIWTCWPSAFDDNKFIIIIIISMTFRLWALSEAQTKQTKHYCCCGLDFEE